MTPWKLDSSWLLEIYPRVPKLFVSPIKDDVVFGCIILSIPWILEVSWEDEMYPIVPKPIIVEVIDVWPAPALLI